MSEIVNGLFLYMTNIWNDRGFGAWGGLREKEASVMLFLPSQNWSFPYP